MRLENLYTNFGKSSPEEQAKFVAAYRLRRAMDLDTPIKTKTKTSTPKQNIELSEAELTLMKMLGLKKKDMFALRTEITSDNPEETGTGEDLFKDSTFDEGEE
jgi:hypothetical protein